MNVPGQYLNIQNGKYDDLLKETDIVQRASIPSKIIESNYLSVFVTYDTSIDNNFDNKTKLRGLLKSFNQLKSNADYEITEIR